MGKNRSIVEQLERRRMLSGDGVWTITGSDAGESITIDLRASDQRLRAIVNGQVISTRLLRGLGLIEVLANGGNDTIKIDLHDANPGLGLWVNAGPGRDRVYGGAGDECLIGGSGRDVIDGGRGNDIVRGGTDRDDCNGGDGNDYVQGNAGNDTLAGGWGDDRITGGTGVDQLRGGEGDDRIAGGKDADILKGGPGDDRLEAGGGTANTIYRVTADDQTVTGSSDVMMNDDDDDQALTRLQSDAELKQWLIDQAVKQWKSSFGQETGGSYWASHQGTVLYAFSDSSLSSLVAADSASLQSASKTNTQEEGVDEADLVETDGRYLYMLHNNELIIADADPAAQLKIVSRTKLEGSPSGIYLDGDRVTVISSVGGYGTWYGGGGRPIFFAVEGAVTTSSMIAPPTEPQKAEVLVNVFDVADAAHPSLVSASRFDGTYTDSRVIDGRLYLVLSNFLSAPTPKTSKTGDQEFYESEEAYRARLESGGVAEMIPGWTSGSSQGDLLQAPDVYVRDGDRLDAATVALINLRAPDPSPISTTSIIGTQGQIYASQDNLYLAGNGWYGVHTELFKFELGIDQVSLAASGKVEGWVKDQFSMDEEGEFFRVATSQYDAGDTINGASVMDQIGDDLTVVGQIKDLGINETLYAARFIGDRGYLVTFRQIDPLFTLDLSEPTNPKLVGELEIPGYSQYLQPINHDYILGLGRTVEANEPGDLQLSLFNVSDPSKPTRVDTFEFDSDWSFATPDHHAFSYFADEGVLALPVGDGKLGVLKVDLVKGFTNLGTITHEQNATTLRAVRIGENLFSIGTDGVRAYALNDLKHAVAVLDLPDPDSAP